MSGPDNHLMGFQPNPNDFGKCSNCGKVLTSKKEEKVQLCKDCQKRHKDEVEDLDQPQGE
ncbi:hypothetical protein [Thalassobacillus pellis]|uniref:hypothetical protein n=1 Tax=Thalassobacillus pellis TaxID=748008 RepID=UPI0019615611|nr:hypothetical protein [Thalassobacillus pellis]MBM7551894.1 hypothetical protein [Thalassobacillus pellis]